MTRTVRSAAVATLAALAAVAAIIAADFTAPASAQAQSDEQSSGYIIARRTADDRIEFGWRTPSGAQVFPRARYFPPDAKIDRWLTSSPVIVGGTAIGRINARMRLVGRIEFAFTPTDGERILPPSRYFPHNARIGRWLSSTEITIGPPVAASAGTFRAIAAGWDSSACAIRDTGEIACWGSNGSGQATDFPAGRFSAIATTGVYCGLRENGEIACWGGYNNEESAQPPAGSFTAISGGSNPYFCALSARGAIACWGKPPASPPTGTFTAISTGADDICAIRASDRAIECWGRRGSDEYGEYQDRITPPTGEIRAVSAGHDHTCAIRTSGELVCWGDDSNDQTNPPPGTFTAIDHTCAIRTSGELACWGRYHDDDQTNPPPGTFTAINRRCAIRTSGELACWGALYRKGENPLSGGRFTAINTACGLRESGVVSCWYGGSRTTTPAGTFSTIGSDYGGGWPSCAIRTSGAIECWCDSDSWQQGHQESNPPTGSFRALSTGSDHACAIHADGGEIECWGDGSAGQRNAPLMGGFTAINAGHEHTCAIRTSGAIECWGKNDVPGRYQSWLARGLTEAPAGSFTSIDASDGHTCATRSDGAVICWGTSIYYPPK